MSLIDNYIVKREIRLLNSSIATQIDLQKSKVRNNSTLGPPKTFQHDSTKLGKISNIVEIR